MINTNDVTYRYNDEGRKKIYFNNNVKTMK